MRKKSIKLKKFLNEHPLCCFCGGNTKSATQDHIPPRSFFLKRNYPKGLEFPACKSCNNKTSNEEDIARILSMIQGTTFNEELARDFENRSESYIKAISNAKIGFIDEGIMVNGNSMVKIDEKSTESITMLSTKIVLALYYNIYNRPIKKEQRIALTFFTADKITDELEGNLVNWVSTPLEQDFGRIEIASQFFYRYIQFSKLFNKENEKGWDFSIVFHMHRGFICIAKVYEDESFLQPPYNKIVRTVLRNDQT